MTKADLIDRVHEKLEGAHSKKDVTAVVEASFDALAEAIREGRFSYPGFGTFTTKERKARQGRNPRTSEDITIPASKTVSFKPAPKFKDSL